MKPIEFDEQNTIAKSNEPNIEPLPCCLLDGQVISCWELTPDEIEVVKRTGKIYVSQLSGKCVVPIFLTTDKHDLFIYPNETSNETKKE